MLDEIIAKANPDAVHGFAHEVKNAGKASPEGEGNWAKSSFEDLVQYNDGFRANLIGTPEQIAERIIAIKEAGVDLVLLGFLHFQEEVEFFGRRVIPLVRELEASAFAPGGRGGIGRRRPPGGRSARIQETSMNGAVLRAELPSRVPRDRPARRPPSPRGDRAGAPRHRADFGGVRALKGVSLDVRAAKSAR